MVGLGMTLLWSAIPDAITLLIFLSFTKLAGQQLDIPTAFTAISILNLMRSPLTYLPAAIMGILQTFVSISRIETYLDEPEVPGWVSSLSDETNSSSSIDQKIGFENGTFKWNDNSTSAISEAEQKSFELQNINVVFPPGKLSLICTLFFLFSFDSWLRVAF